MTEGWWVVADKNSWQKESFILDNLEFYANRSSRTSFCLLYEVNWPS